MATPLLMEVSTGCDGVLHPQPVALPWIPIDTCQTNQTFNHTISFNETDMIGMIVGMIGVEMDGMSMASSAGMGVCVGDGGWSGPHTGRGIIPPGRGGHTGCFVEGALYVFGGSLYTRKDNQQQQQGSAVTVVDDLYVFEVANTTWTRLTPPGTPPSPRYAHTATPVGKKLVAILLMHTMTGIIAGCIWRIQRVQLLG